MRIEAPPVLLQDVLDDVDEAIELMAAQAPYTPLGGWYNPGADQTERTRPMWFQNDWVHDTFQAPGSELFLRHPAYIDAAKAYYGAEIVEPHSVYVNHMMAIDGAGPAHTDNPRFAGRDRANTPMWLLRKMFWSGLFDDVAIPQATAIWWMNDVDGGAFRYWPHGPDKPPAEHVGAMANTALVGDNHGMFHQVGSVGPHDRGTVLVSPSAQLQPVGDPQGEWVVTDLNADVHRAPLDDIRVSVLWKADVYRDDAARAAIHDRALTLADVAARFDADLEQRGLATRFDPDRVEDPAHIAEISGHYPEPRPVDALPSVYDR